MDTSVFRYPWNSIVQGVSIREHEISVALSAATFDTTIADWVIYPLYEWQVVVRTNSTGGEDHTAMIDYQYVCHLRTVII